MNHLTDIAFIHAHTKGNGGHNYRRITAHKTLLNGITFFVTNTGMIGFNGKRQLSVQGGGDFLGGILQGDINNRGKILVFFRTLFRQIIQPSGAFGNALMLCGWLGQ